MHTPGDFSHFRDDKRVSALWWFAKALFGVLVIVGVNNANDKLSELAITSTNQKLDHQEIENLKTTTAQTVETLKSMSSAIQANTLSNKLNTQAIQSLNERQAKDDDFRETHSSKATSRWTHE